jgi:hypothetical protein
MKKWEEKEYAAIDWELDIKKLWCYSDSKIVIELLFDSVNPWHHYAVIIHNIKDLIAKEWSVKY